MAKVTKAIIAAAGLGSRMFPYTKVESKLLIPIGNKPMIELLLEELTASGIKEVIIVSNHTHNIKNLLKDDPRIDKLLKKLKKDKIIKKLDHLEYMADVKVINQDTPMGWMHEVFHARDKLEKGPFIVCFSDVLYKSDVPAAKQAIDHFNKSGKNVKAIARFVLKPEVFDMAKEEDFEVGKDLVDEEIFEVLKRKNDFEYFNIKGKMLDIGTPLSYLKAQTFFALDDPEYGKEYKKFLKELVSEL